MSKINTKKTDDERNPLSEGDLKRLYQDNPLLGLTFDQYQKSQEHDYDYFVKIDRWREFLDSILLNNDAESIGGQIIMPQLRKLFKGMENPDGTLKRIAGINREELLLSDSFIRSENERLKIDNLWENNKEQLKKDGIIFSVFKIDGETGEQYEDFVSRKRLSFSAGADNVHPIKDGDKGSNWMFEFESVQGISFREDYIHQYGDVVKKVIPGNPISPLSFNAENVVTAIKSNEESIDKDLNPWFDKNVGVLTAWCLSSPMGMKAEVNGEEVEIKKGEPFLFKVAGGNKEILMISKNEDYVWKWANKKTDRQPDGKPYLPANPYFDTRYRKGLQVLSFAGISIPYIRRIMRLEEGVDKFINLMADPDFFLNFKRSGSATSEPGSDDNIQTIKNWVALNLKKKLEGKKTTNFIVTDTEDNTDIDIKQATPSNLNIESVELRMERLKGEFADIVGVMVNDVSYPEDAKVGIIEYKERQQSEEVGGWQELNEDNFVMRNRMLLNHLIIFPKRSKRNIPVVEKGKRQEFTYEKPLQEFRETISPKVLDVPWKFSFSRPTGGVEAIAEQDAHARMVETISIVGPLPSLVKAVLQSQQKIISFGGGADAFSADEAFKEFQKLQGAEEGLVKEPRTQSQLDGEKLVEKISA